jgi:uncharacterized protein (DUF2267 family)
VHTSKELNKKEDLMKKVMMVMTLCALIVVFCGAPEETPKVEKAEEKPQVDFYYAVLNEGEIQRFIKAMPAFQEAAKDLNEELGSLESAEAFMAMAGQYSTLHKQMPELDAKLRAAGMPWEEFWPALGKTYMALAAVFMDSVMTEMKDQMKGQENDMVKEMMKGMEEASVVYKEVPQVNKDLVKKHMAELQTVLEME